MTEFVHLHSHSEYSLIDGLGKMERLIAAVAEKGFKSHALTEHGTLAGSMGFQLLCERYGIKPIQGLEGYITVDGQRGHITVLSDGVKGWGNLVSLNNLAQKSGESKPVFTPDDLINHADGLILLTGCMASPLQKMALPEAMRLGANLKAAFDDRLFAEIMFLPDGEESIERSIRLSEGLHIPLVVTNDVHFPYASDAAVHSVLTRLKAAYAYNSANLYLKSFNDLKTSVAPYRGLIDDSRAVQAMQQAVTIADRLQPVNLKRTFHLPSLEGVKDENATLYNLTMKQMVRKGLMGNATYVERAKYELDVIAKMEFSNYFLILLEIVWIAKDIGARIGAGRGSGAGSLVLYLLGITDIDPIEWGLQFERFLNPNRKEMPDVDMDFDSCHRQELLDKVSEKFGAVQIATFSTYSHKSLTRDLCKYFSVPLVMAEGAIENGADSAEFSKLCAAYPDLKLCYDAMEGQTRHKGKHAGGVVMVESGTMLPLENIGGIQCSAWAEGFNRELSESGFVKFDLLGVSALDALQRLETLTGETAPFPPKDDDEVFKLFQTGKLAGVFQFSGSAGINRLTVDVQPTTFIELVAINALYRPATLGAGTAQRYVEWKKTPRKIHPLLDSILSETYGIICFQEQVMAIIAAVTGGNLSYADDARKLFSKPKHGDKKWEDAIKKLEKEFKQGAKKTVGAVLGDSLWNELVEHSKYSFNKSHSTAYSRLAWELAWFKYHHPAYFYATMLNIDPDNSQEYLLESAQSKIEISPPHVNVSGFEYVAVGNTIYMPLSAVKFFGAEGAKTLVEERERNGNFTSITDFVERLPKKKVNKRAKEGLYSVGAFKGVSGDVADFKVKDIVITTDRIEAEKKWLGFVIPKPDIVAMIDKLNGLGYMAGIVESVEIRNKGRGDYTVFRLLPKGVFWARGRYDDFNKGDIVRATMKQNGQAGTVGYLI